MWRTNRKARRRTSLYVAVRNKRLSHKPRWRPGHHVRTSDELWPLSSFSNNGSRVDACLIPSRTTCMSTHLQVAILISEEKYVERNGNQTLTMNTSGVMKPWSMTPWWSSWCPGKRKASRKEQEAASVQQRCLPTCQVDAPDSPREDKSRNRLPRWWQIKKPTLLRTTK